MARQKVFQIVGLLFVTEDRPCEDPEDIFDFITARWSDEELMLALKMRVLIPGMVVSNADNNYQVVIERDRRLELVGIHNFLKEHKHGND